jgi:hypothetical protein
MISDLEKLGFKKAGKWDKSEKYKSKVDIFCDFVSCLIRRDGRYDILKCRGETPEWESKFKQAIEEMWTNHKDLKLNNYKELEKLCKEGYTFLIGRGMDMQFEKQMWNLSELSSYVKELCKKGKRVSIIALKSNQIITSENPLKVEGLCIEKFLQKNKDVKVFRVIYKECRKVPFELTEI